MILCHYSTSQILASSILPSCPLDLKATAAKNCPCRKRLYHVPPADLRVLSCTYPDDWRGRTLTDADEAAIRTRLQSKPSRTTSKNGRNATMATDAPTAAADTDDGTLTDLTPSNSTALATMQHDPSMNSLTVWDRFVDPLDAVAKLGLAFYNARMFGCKEPQQGTVLALACFCEKKSPFDLIRTYDIIGGKLSMKSAAMLAQFEAIGGEFDIVERSPEKAAIRLSIKRGRGKAREYMSEVTWAEIKDEPWTKDQNGNLKPTYATPRGRMQMLWARAVSDGVRTIAPGVNAGYYTPEEVGDFSESNQPALSVEGEMRRRELQGRQAQQVERATVATAANPAAPITVAATPLPEPASTVPTGAPGTEPAPAAAPPPPATATPADPPITQHEIDNLKSWLASLQVPTETWKELLAKAGVQSGNQLTHSGYLRFVAWFEKRKAEKDAAEAAAGRVKTEVEQWVEGALGTGTPPTQAPAPN